MADKKITQLTNITGANLVDADEFVVVDISADETKAITLGELKEAFDSGSGFVRITGDTMTGDLALSGADVTFGDNDKAIFGAGSDLQIYHDGSNSVITDGGSGSLLLRGSNVWIQNADGTETGARFITDGAIDLRYDNSVKLATTSTGIDVTGTVTADGLTVDGDGLFNGGFNDPKTITLNSLRSVQDNVLGKILFQNTSNDVAEIYANSGPDGTNRDEGKLIFRTAEAGGTMRNRMLIDYIGDISFYDSQGSSQSFFWDASAERLGIGNAAPTTALDVTGTITSDGLTVDGDGLIQASTGAKLQIKSTTNFVSPNDVVGSLDFVSADYNYTAQPIKGQISSVATNPSGTGESALFISTTETTNLRNRIKVDYNGDISFYEDTGTTAKFFWDASAESLGIGTSSPSAVLDLVIPSPAATASSGGLEITEGTKAFALSTTGSSYNYAGVGANELWYYANSNFGALTFGSDGAVPIKFISSGTERMRIDSSGNLLVGKTSASKDTVGSELKSDGRINATMTSGSPILANRQTTDGDIAVFQKDNTTVGSIGTELSRLYIGSDDSMIFFDAGSTNAIWPWSSTATSSGDADDTIDIGDIENRFKDLYLSGGVYLGGTGAANKLDDVEFGTWTPAFTEGSGGTNIVSGTNTASYVKIGSFVFCEFRTNCTSSSGFRLHVSNLPFAVSVGNAQNGMVTLHGVDMGSWYSLNSSEFAAYSTNAAGNYPCSNANGVLRGTLTYQTSA